MKKFRSAALKLEFCVAISLFCLLGCKDSRTGELSRKLATQLLNERFVTQHVSGVTFTYDGFEKAVQDGIVESDANRAGAHFSAKGLKFVGSVIHKNEVFRIQHREEFFTKRNAIIEEVTEVTGILELGSPNIKRVEYVSKYRFPGEMDLMKPYVTCGKSGVRILKKYDDGWRVAETAE